MLASKAPLVLYEVDLKQFNKTLDKEMGIILRGAIRVWLQTVLKSIQRAPYSVGGDDTFPMQTGAAKGALKPLARAIRMALSIRPAPKRPNLIAKGEAASSYDIRDDRSHPLSFIYRFSWGTDLVQWTINEVSSMNYPHGSRTPWNAIKKADRAFIDHIRREVPKRLRAKARLSQGILRVKK